MARRSLRIWGLALAAALTTSSLAACGGGSSASGQPEKPDSPVTLRMTTWTSDETQIKTFESIADGYIKEHPDLVKDVKFETVSGDDYMVGLTTQIAGGNVPDLAWILESNGPEFVKSGALTNLTPYLEKAKGYDLDDLLPNALDLWRDGDAIYAYPFSNSPFGVFVNTDLIKAAGQPNPADLVAKGQWTWDKARDISAAVAKTSGNNGLVIRDFDYTNWENLAEVWDSWGAAPWSDDGTTCTMDSPQMVEAMTWIHDAIFKDGAIPGPGTDVDFFGGKTAMTVTQVSRASGLDGSFHWDLVPLPSGPEGHVNVIGQAGIGVLAQGAHPDIAANFLAYFTDAASAKKLAGFFPPPRQSLIKASTLKKSNPLLSEKQLQEVVVDGVKDAVTKPSHPNFAQIKETTRIALDDLWKPDADVKSVLGNVCDQIAPLLKD
ncbi:sugar ABC transporter substrate-binding protein [Nocardioides sp. KR10-350]|uniref:ABC transporter substrate-binding protein n=1 Tax=Nocardioides cheoyonin TaxID=3156615 RepID=UPI0032B5C68E